MDASIAMLEHSVRNTEQLLVKIDARLNLIDMRLGEMDRRFDQMDKRLDQMDKRMDRMDDRRHSDFKWLMGLGFASNGFLFVSMAHGFHWI